MFSGLRLVFDWRVLLFLESASKLANDGAGIPSTMAIRQGLVEVGSIGSAVTTSPFSASFCTCKLDLKFESQAARV